MNILRFVLFWDITLISCTSLRKRSTRSYFSVLIWRPHTLSLNNYFRHAMWHHVSSSISRSHTRTHTHTHTHTCTHTYTHTHTHIYIYTHIHTPTHIQLYRAFHNVLHHLQQENQKTYLNGIVHSHRKTDFFFWQLELFDVCTTGDTAHIDKIFNF